MITTNDDAVAGLARMLRAHGARKKYYNEVPGYSSRLDELQATLLRAKFVRLDEFNARRIEPAERYGHLLKEVNGITIPQRAVDGTLCCWSLGRRIGRCWEATRVPTQGPGWAEEGWSSSLFPSQTKTPTAHPGPKAINPWVAGVKPPIL
jgi:hypothetical protein